jgi:hypothetical protein
MAILLEAASHGAIDKNMPTTSRARCEPRMYSVTAMQWLIQSSMGLGGSHMSPEPYVKPKVLIYDGIISCTSVQ